MEKQYFAHDSAFIDEGCNIGQNVVISPEVILGKNVKVQNNVSIYTGVICDDDVFLGPSMVFTNVINPRSAVNRKSEYAKTYVGKGASIGANATIVCGHNIGDYAFIGAGAVVTKTVPAFALVVGNPSKQIGWMSEYGHRLEFNKDGIAICLESNQTYKLENNSVTRIS
jgi:UDP-2-acetamido-3-amino-2,3-dideoxy-glucuronate N-acetyltransferase